MRLYEITRSLKTFIARVRLSDGSVVSTTERTESLSYARASLQHLYGRGNVLSVNEFAVDEAAAKPASAEDRRISLVNDQAKRLKQQARDMRARQKLAQAQQAVRDARISKQMSPR